MKPSQKNELLDILSIAYNRANYLKAVAEENRDKPTAGLFARRMDRLRLEIDGLLRDLHHDWIGEAESLKGELSRHNRAIQDGLDDIEADVERAKRFVEAIGYLDEVIELAAALVK